MPAATKKGLYLAQNMGQLNSKASDIPRVDDARRFLKTADTLFKKGDESNLLGDEEMAYVFYMRYFRIISAVKTTNEYKKNPKYYGDMIGSRQVQRAITEAEKLSSSLKHRYDEKEAEAASKKLEALHLKEEKEEIADIINAKSDPQKENETQKVPDKDGEIKTDEKADVQNGLSKPRLSISVHDLYQLLKNSADDCVLILDVRPPDQFEDSHIKHSNCINVPSEIIPPGTTVTYIDKALPKESLSLWKKRQTMDNIVMLDWRCDESSLKTKTTLFSLKDAIWKWDAYNKPRSEPVILTGGYEDWLNFYPTLSTNANVPRPLPATNPNDDYTSLDSITYDLDQAFIDSPEKEEKAPSKLDQLRQELNAASDDNTGSKAPTTMPIINRSLKPSVSKMNNIRGTGNTLTAPASSFTRDSTRSSLDMIHNELKKDIGNGDMANNFSHKTIGVQGSAKEQEENDEDMGLLDSRMQKLSGTGATRTTLAGGNMSAKVNNVAALPDVDRRLKPKLGSAEGSAWANAEHAAAQQARQDSEQRMAQHNQQAADRRARLNALKDEESKLEAVEKLKRHELAETADVMRKKRTVQRQLNELQEEVKRAEAEGRARQEELAKLIAEEEKKLFELKEADRLRSLKGGGDLRNGDSGSREERPILPKHTEISARDQNAPKLQAAEELRDAEEKERQRVEQEKIELERAEKEQREKEKAARAEQVERQRLAEVKRLEKERADREWIERENKKLAQRAHKTPGTPVGHPKIRDPITGQYTPTDQGSKPESPSTPRRAGTAASTANVAGTSTPTGPATPDLDPTTASEGNSSSASGSPADHRGVYRKPLRDEDDLPPSGGLRRSHSSPNIAQMVQDEPMEPLRPFTPSVDRSSKPRSPRPDLQTIPAKAEVSAVKVRNLHPTWGSAGRGLTGLRNLGNTCYMNSTIQCLSNTSFLMTYFLNDQYRPDINRENALGKKGEVAEEFAVLIKALWTGQYRSLNPRDFKSVIAKHHPMFAGYDQQDSQEMLTFLLDSLHEDLNKIRKRPKLAEQDNDGLAADIAAEKAWISHKKLNDSVIVDLFQGQFMSTVICTRCEKRSVTFEAFMYLSVPIPSNTHCSLQDCIVHFAKEEKMSGDSQWFCPRCKCSRDAIKRIVIWRLPRILLIHLKRFYYQGMWRQKINTHVDFPLNGLNMDHYIQGPDKQRTYNLYAVSNHYGTMEGGHYTAFCKSPRNGHWYKYDDHEVSEMPRSDIRTSAAYIMYYTSITQDISFAA